MVLTLEDFIAGWIGGICGIIVGHPLDTVKVRQQAYGSRFITALGRTYRHEGISGFFKGIALPLLITGPSNAVLFGIYGNVLHFFHHHHKISYTDTVAIAHVYTAGTIGGFFQTIFVCPAELIKIKLQARTEGRGSWRKHYEVPYTSSFGALRGIVKDQGVKGLFRGLLPLMLRDVPTCGLYTLTYEMLIYRNFSQCEAPLLLKQTVAGGTAGLASCIFVLPFDVVKSRLQVDNPYKPKYRGMMDCFSKSYREEGWRVFFKGTPAILLRTFPVNAATFIGYEFVLAHLQDTQE